MSAENRIAILSTGDPVKDRLEIDSFIRRQRRLDEGICANGCGPMIQTSVHEANCAVCGFHYTSGKPFTW